MIEAKYADSAIKEAGKKYTEFLNTLKRDLITSIYEAMHPDDKRNVRVIKMDESGISVQIGDNYGSPMTIITYDIGAAAGSIK